jgi:hypothetical protein
MAILTGGYMDAEMMKSFEDRLGILTGGYMDAETISCGDRWAY